MSARSVVEHHLAALGAGDVDEILADYTEDSVLITPDGAKRGLDALRATFTAFCSGLFAPGTYEFHLDSLQEEGEIAYIVWHAECASADIPFATDTFLVKDEKITIQTFAAKIEPR